MIEAGPEALVRALRTYVYPQNPAAYHQIVGAGPEAMAAALRPYVSSGSPHRPDPRSSSGAPYAPQPPAMPSRSSGIYASQAPSMSGMHPASTAASGISQASKTSGFKVQPKAIEHPSKWANWQYMFQIIGEALFVFSLIGGSLIGAWFAVFHLGFAIPDPYPIFNDLFSAITDLF